MVNKMIDWEALDKGEKTECPICKHDSLQKCKDIIRCRWCGTEVDQASRNTEKLTINRE